MGSVSKEHPEISIIGSLRHQKYRNVENMLYAGEFNSRIEGIWSSSFFHLRKMLVFRGCFPDPGNQKNSWITVLVVQSDHRLGVEGKIQAGIHYYLKEPYVEWDTL